MSLDGVVISDYECLDMANSLRMLNYSFVFMGAYCSDANSSALVIVFPLN